MVRMFDEGDHHPCHEGSMLSRPQERLLRYIAGYSDVLEKAWDVPRALSLPGLSEAMGIVRSGLNQPLVNLIEEGYISMRIAHVISGGPRRRQVYHITTKGRHWVSEHPEQEEMHQEDDVIRPPFTPILGRNEALLELDKMMNEHRHVVVGGLSGVGVTTFMKGFASSTHRLSASVRWADCHEFSDAKSIFSTWFDQTKLAFEERESMIDFASLSPSPTLFVLDDFHCLSARHEEGVTALLNGLVKAGHCLLIGTRLPFKAKLTWPLFRLSSLEPEDAVAMLGQHLDEAVRLNIAKALGGHPTAMQLYRDGDQLPEAATDIQEFVKQTMLLGLSEEEQYALDHMVLFPRPIPVEHAPQADYIGELDERALLRWTQDSLSVEVQHLVRNVRRAMLTKEQLNVLHLSSREHWKQFSDQAAYRLLHLYHAMALDSEDIDQMLEVEIEKLLVSESAALAVMFERALEQRNDEILHYWAGRIALERQELNRVTPHLEHVSNTALKDDLAYQLALLNGDERQAQQILEHQLEHANTFEKSRMLLRAAVQLLDDRLFDEPQKLEVNQIQSLLQRIELPSLAQQRTSVIVSLSMIKHALALLDNDIDAAKDVVEGLQAISHEHDAIVLHLQLKTLLHESIHTGAVSMLKLTQVVEQAMSAQHSPVHRASIGLAYTEYLVKKKDEAAAAFFAQLPQPNELTSHGAPLYRYTARWWYLISHLDHTRTPMALREASRAFRQAGCLRASKAAARRLHRVL